MEQSLIHWFRDKEIEAVNAASLVQKLLQVTSGQVYNSEREVVTIHNEKIKELKAIRKEHPKEPLIVVTLFKHERANILKAFPDAQLFDQQDLAKWNRGEIPVLIIDPRSAAHGINFQLGGHILVWFTLTYSREMWDQTNARLARKGQKHTVLVYRIMCPDTVDWAVSAVLENKGEQQKGLLTALSNVKKLHENR